MIVGIGSDIARIERFKQAVKRHGPRFAQRILGPEEAFVKALGLGLRAGMQWGEIQVLNDGLGKPYLVVEGKAERLLSEAGVTASHITLSDEAEYAVAFVVLERA